MFVSICKGNTFQSNALLQKKIYGWESTAARLRESTARMYFAVYLSPAWPWRDATALVLAPNPGEGISQWELEHKENCREIVEDMQPDTPPETEVYTVIRYRASTKERHGDDTQHIRQQHKAIL